MDPIVRNSHGNVSRYDIERMNVRYKQWRQMTRHRQNQRINKFNLIQELLNM